MVMKQSGQLQDVSFLVCGETSLDEFGVMDDETAPDVSLSAAVGGRDVFCSLRCSFDSSWSELELLCSLSDSSLLLLLSDSSESDLLLSSVKVRSQTPCPGNRLTGGSNENTMSSRRLGGGAALTGGAKTGISAALSSEVPVISSSSTNWLALKTFALLDLPSLSLIEPLLSCVYGPALRLRVVDDIPKPSQFDPLLSISNSGCTALLSDFSFPSLIVSSFSFSWYFLVMSRQYGLRCEASEEDRSWIRDGTVALDLTSGGAPELIGAHRSEGTVDPRITGSLRASRAGVLILSR